MLTTPPDAPGSTRPSNGQWPMRVTESFGALVGRDAGRRRIVAQVGGRGWPWLAAMVALAAALLPGQAVRAAGPAPSAPARMSGPWDMIAFAVKSWGRSVTS